MIINGSAKRRNEDKTKESAIAWAEYTGREAAMHKQMMKLREQRLAKESIAPVVKPPAPKKTKHT